MDQTMILKITAVTMCVAVIMGLVALVSSIILHKHQKREQERLLDEMERNLAIDQALLEINQQPGATGCTKESV